MDRERQYIELDDWKDNETRIRELDVDGEIRRTVFIRHNNHGHNYLEIVRYSIGEDDDSSRLLEKKYVYTGETESESIVMSCGIVQEVLGEIGLPLKKFHFNFRGNHSSGNYIND